MRLPITNVFIPLMRREIIDFAHQAAMHPVISSHNWIYFRETDNFDNAFASLINALDVDLSNARQYPFAGSRQRMGSGQQ